MVANESQSALDIWKEKLNDLQKQEVFTSDPDKKFQIKQSIKECQQKIKELEKSVDPFHEENQPFHNLPQPDYGQFIGREEEQTKILKKLRPYPHSTNSVITIDGIGGIGKSALALEISLNFLRNYRKFTLEERFDAIIWTSAKRRVLKADRGIVNRRQAVKNLEDICHTIAIVLRVDELCQTPSEERLKLICRELTKKRTLLIIDNLETVDDLAVMEFLQDLLPAPTKAIVTTRHRIDVAYPIRLRGMPLNDAEILIQQECQKKGVNLSDEQKGQLYKRTGGVPLAIVLSIAQMGFGYTANYVLKKLGNYEGGLMRFCFQETIEQIRDKNAYKILLGLALCKDDASRDEIGFLSGLEDDQLSRDEGLVELDKLSLVNKKGDKFSLLPLTKDYVSSQFEISTEFVSEAILRLINYHASRDFGLTQEYWEKYNYRLSDSTRVKALRIINDKVFEIPQGVVPLESLFYVERPPLESDCYETIMQPGALIRVKAPRQMGKSSLMARILFCAKQAGYEIVSLNFQLVDNDCLKNLDQFLQWVCASISEELELPTFIEEYWEGFLGSKKKCTNYFQRYLLSRREVPLVLGLDEVDQVFRHPEIATGFLGLLRAWHEKGKNDPVWQKLRLVIVHSKEVYIPLDINQSPFNVGFSVELPEFTPSQVEDLAKRHGLHWSVNETEKLIEMCGGHPYLIRLALYEIVKKRMTLTQLLSVAPTEEGIYQDHLRRHLLNLEQNESLLIAFKQVVATNNPVQIGSSESFKLKSMGLVKFQGNKVMPLCQLYRQYFRNRLDIS